MFDLLSHSIMITAAGAVATSALVTLAMRLRAREADASIGAIAPPRALAKSPAPAIAIAYPPPSIARVPAVDTADPSSEPASAACLEVLARAKHVDAQAAFAGRVLRTLDDPRSSPDAVAREIARDQGLMTMVLRAANSPFYGARGQVKDITEALVVLGYESTRELVIARLSRVSLGKLDDVRALFWRHALASAIAAQACARAVRGVTVGHAFTIGLIHDLGKGLLYDAYPDAYRALATAAGDLRASHVLERERFGTDHVEVGSEALRAWQLPPAYVRITRAHRMTDDDKGLSPREARLRAIVVLGSTVASWLGHGRYPARPIAELIEHPSFITLSAGPDLARAMAEAVENELASYEGIIH